MRNANGPEDEDDVWLLSDKVCSELAAWITATEHNALTTDTVLSAYLHAGEETARRIVFTTTKKRA